MQQGRYTEKEIEIISAIAKVVIKLRKNKKKSQRMFAFEYDIHKSLISRMESGKNQPMLFSIWKVAEAFNMPPSKFLKLVEKELPQNFVFSDI